jgi:hypothetical protein
MTHGFSRTEPAQHHSSNGKARLEKIDFLELFVSYDRYHQQKSVNLFLRNDTFLTVLARFLPVYFRPTPVSSCYK